MKAIVWTAYGPPDVLQLREVDLPVPGENQVRIRVHAATVNAGDCEVRGLDLPLWLRLPLRVFAGIRKPGRIQILGQELAGTIDAVGKNVTRFKEGDPVFGATGFSFGAYAEYACLPQNSVLARKPANMDFEHAAAVPVGGLEALHFIRKGTLRAGDAFLINGAGGSIGTIAVQLAKDMGAEVTAVDSAEKLDMLRSLGADHLIDYTREDFTRSGRAYDAIFDVVGKSPFSRSLRALKPGGRYLIGNPRLSTMVRGRLGSALSGKQVILETAAQRREDLITLRELIEAGRIHTVIDRRFPLAEAAEAHRYVESGRKKGNVIITVGS
jgi:NADPH:quinone reductase-like Zn-dependent oxidoreductase